MNKVTTLITGILTLILAVFAFVLSFSNLYKLAAESGVAYPALIPLMIEGAVVVFSVAMLRNSLHGDPVRTLWALIISSSLLATSFNVYHSDTGNVMSMIMAGVPSVFLLLSFETFISQIRKVSDRASIVQTLEDLAARQQTAADSLRQLEQELTAKRQAVQVLEQKRETMKVQKLTTAKEKNLKKLKTIYSPGKTKTELAKELGVHVNTVTNYMEELSLNGK